MTLITNHLKSHAEPTFGSDQIVQILSLDGGGLKGLFTAAVIESIENQTNRPIGDHFDIITGTSTGGLVALGLGLGKSGKEIVDFYKNDGPKIFPNSALQFWRGWIFNKYSNTALHNTLKTLLTTDTQTEPLLKESNKRLIIPTFHAAQSQPRLLKTPHDKRYKSDWKLPMWAVAMATSAAPTYLPSFKFHDQTYLDGGLWANNPSLIGVIEALEMGASIENIRVLNITTTSSNRDCLYWKCPLLPKTSLGRLGKIPWASRVLNVMMQANSYATTHMYLRQMLAQGNLAVIDEIMNHGHADLDQIDYEEFYGLGRTAGEQAKNQLEPFFEHESSEYIPNKEAMNNG